MGEHRDRGWSNRFGSTKTLHLLVTMGLGIVVVAIYTRAQTNAGWRGFAVAVMASASAAILGWLLGFLFGIPRTLQSAAPVDRPQGAPPPPGAASPAGPAPALVTPGEAPDVARTEYAANTNLEQISDWLTKILVGIGLTQVGPMTAHIRELATALGQAIAGPGEGFAFALALLLFYAVAGFLQGYLWTRLYLPGALHEADTAKQALAEARRATAAVAQVQEQQVKDAAALAIVQRQLDPTPGEPPPDAAQLTAALANASPPVLAHVFARAHDTRKENREQNNARMALTIPIFRALADNDVAGNFHRNHAQLGYALKDQARPTDDDLRAAEQALTRAIQIRDAQGVGGWSWYETVRAICRIRLDPEYRAGKTSTETARAAILADLGAGRGHRYPQEIIARDKDIRAWLERNNVDPNAI